MPHPTPTTIALQLTPHLASFAHALAGIAGALHALPPEPDRARLQNALAVGLRLGGDAYGAVFCAVSPLVLDPEGDLPVPASFLDLERDARRLTSELARTVHATAPGQPLLAIDWPSFIAFRFALPMPLARVGAHLVQGVRLRDVPALEDITRAEARARARDLRDHLGVETNTQVVARILSARLEDIARTRRPAA